MMADSHLFQMYGYFAFFRVFLLDEHVPYDIHDMCRSLEVLKYSLEQYIGFVGRQAFIHYCGLDQV